MSNEQTPCERAAQAMAALGISRHQHEALGTFVVLARAWETVTSKLRASLLELDITESQFGVLEALFSMGPQCQRALGEKILKSSGNLTMVVDNLERRGLVRRERDTEDRRHVMVSITPDGDSLIRRALPLHAQAIESTIGALTHEEQETLRRLCQTIFAAKDTSGAIADDSSPIKSHPQPKEG